MKRLGRDTISYPISSLANKQGEKGGGRERGKKEKKWLRGDCSPPCKQRKKTAKL